MVFASDLEFGCVAGFKLGDMLPEGECVFEAQPVLQINLSPVVLHFKQLDVLLMSHLGIGFLPNMPGFERCRLSLKCGYFMY